MVQLAYEEKIEAVMPLGTAKLGIPDQKKHRRMRERCRDVRYVHMQASSIAWKIHGPGTGIRIGGVNDKSRS